MALTKVNGIWQYDFWFKKKRFQGSTYQRNVNKARLVEAQVRSDAGLEARGIATAKTFVSLDAFLKNDLTTYVERENKAKPRTISFYKEKIRRLLEFPAFAEARLDQIDEKLIEKFKNFRLTNSRRSRGEGKIAPASVNRELATLKKALRLAYEFNMITRVPKIRMLPGEAGREYVLDGKTETRYLAAAPYPLREVATLMIDLGPRPDELVSAPKSAVDLAGRSISVTGKTGQRDIPLTDRAVETLKLLFELWPDSPWVFPGQRKGTHLTIWALDNLHADVRAAGEFPKEFVLYSCRHTFGTRLGESGADAFAIKKLMGHASVTTSEKYVHPGNEHMERAMRRKEMLDRLMRGEEVHEEAPH